MNPQQEARDFIVDIGRACVVTVLLCLLVCICFCVSHE